MRVLIAPLLLFAFSLPASASPYFHRGEAEKLVSSTFPEFYSFIEQYRGDTELYERQLLQGVSMAMRADTAPRLVDAWEARLFARLEFRELAEEWRSDQIGRTPELLDELLEASRRAQLAELELLETRRVIAEDRLDSLDLEIDDMSLDFEELAAERVDKKIGR